MNKFIAPIILIAISAGVFFTFIAPQYREVKEQLAISKSYSEAITNSNKLLKEREVKLKKFNEISEDDRDRLEKVVPDNIDNVRLIIDVNEIARKYGAGIRDVKVDRPAEVGPAEMGAEYRSAVLNFVVVMPYSSFVRFLQDLESSLRILDVVSFGFKSTDTDLNIYSVTLKTYWLNK